MANHPGERIAKRGQILALLPVGIPVAAAIEGSEPRAVVDHHMPVGEKFRRPDDGAVGVNGILIETDARQESLQSRIAMPENELAVEPGARFIDEVVADGSHVRTRKGMGSLVLLSQAKSRKR